MSKPQNEDFLLEKEPGNAEKNNQQKISQDSVSDEEVKKPSFKDQAVSFARNSAKLIIDSTEFVAKTAIRTTQFVVGSFVYISTKFVQGSIILAGFLTCDSLNSDYCCKAVGSIGGIIEKISDYVCDSLYGLVDSGAKKIKNYLGLDNPVKPNDDIKNSKKEQKEGEEQKEGGMSKENGGIGNFNKENHQKDINNYMKEITKGIAETISQSNEDNSKGKNNSSLNQKNGNSNQGRQ